MDIEEHVDFLIKDAAWVSDKQELMNRIQRKGQISVKFGIDPSGVGIHLGHVVSLRMLRRFQNLGHRAKIILGEITSTVGDPSGMLERRTKPYHYEAYSLAHQIKNQILRILLTDRTSFYHQADWLAKLHIVDILRNMGRVSVQQLLDRPDFKRRIQAGKPLYLDELTYQLLQAIDSNKIDCDVEIGTEDQRYNMILAGEYMKKQGRIPQVCITTHTLVGTDGNLKMGMDTRYMIGMSEPETGIFSKIMSIPDRVMDDWFQYLTDYEGKDHDNPRDRKRHLARLIVEMLYDRNAAKVADEAWIKKVSLKEVSDTDAVISVIARPHGNILGIVDLLMQTGLAVSRSDASRLIKQKSIRIGYYQYLPEDDRSTIHIEEGMIIYFGQSKKVKIQFHALSGSTRQHDMRSHL